jgi:hypothetical protein
MTSPASLTNDESGDARPVPADRQGRDPDQVTMLASGVFAGGTPRLIIGSRYIIGIRGPAILVLGPVDTAPDRVVLSHDLSDIRASGIGDRFLLSASDPARVALGFIGVLGRSVEDLEAAIDAGRRAAADGSPLG